MVQDNQGVFFLYFTQNFENYGNQKAVCKTK